MINKLILLLINLLIIGGHGTLYGQRSFELGDLNKIQSLSDPQVSPDGKSVLVVVSIPDTAINKNKSFLYKIDAKTKEKQQLTFERDGVYSPRWSANGKDIAFISPDMDKIPQIYSMSTHGGEAQKLTSSSTGIQQFSWSPDGSKIAYVQSDEIENQDRIKIGYDAFEVSNHSMFVRSKSSPSHIWIIDINKGETKRVTSGEWMILPHAQISWCADGKYIAFQKNKLPYLGDLITTVEKVELANKEISRITDYQIDVKSMHKERQPVFSPDGKSIVYQYQLENVGYGANIHLINNDGSESNNLTLPLDRCFFKAQWSGDSKSVFTVANDFDAVSMWELPIKGNPKKLNLSNLVIKGAYFWQQFNVGKTNKIAFIASSTDSPEELYILESPESSPQQLTDFNKELRNLKYGKEETFMWNSDEFRPNGILTYPPNFKSSNKYPLVVHPHGGPRSTSTKSFNPRVQLMAAQGYIVFQPNYRGSDNMGYQFSEATNGDMGKGPGRDVMNGLAELKKRSYIDTTKIALRGWSYGGFMTTWLIGNYKGWKCAIAGAAVTDWISQYTLSDVGGIFRFEYGKGISPYTNKKVMDNWIKNSPLTYVSNVTTPTLLLSNTGDERVPINQSYTYYRALQDNGIESKFIVFPISGHYPSDPNRQTEVNRITLEWLSKYLN